jgi:hypothetical protein
MLWKRSGTANQVNRPCARVSSHSSTLEPVCNTCSLLTDMPAPYLLGLPISEIRWDPFFPREGADCKVGAIRSRSRGRGSLPSSNWAWHVVRRGGSSSACSVRVRLERDRPVGHTLPAWPPRPVYAPEPNGPVRALLGVMTSESLYIWELKYMGARKLVQIPPSARWGTLPWTRVY